MNDIGYSVRRSRGYGWDIWLRDGDFSVFAGFAFTEKGAHKKGQRLVAGYAAYVIQRISWRKENE